MNFFKSMMISENLFQDADLMMDEEGMDDMDEEEPEDESTDEDEDEDDMGSEDEE